MGSYDMPSLILLTILKVLKTDDTERTKGLLISDVINVKTEGDKVLQQNVTVCDSCS